MPDFSTMKQRFEEYAGLFVSDDPMDLSAIRLKYIHSKRVSNQILQLGRCLSLDEEDLETAGIAGLFHDIGRFRQYQVYRTFRDSKSENHALLGLSEIERHKLFEGLKPSRAEIIKTAIGYHNIIRLHDIPDHKTEFFSKLLRDADKLDIWRVMTAHVKKESSGCHDPVTQNLPAGENVSEKLLKQLEDGITIPLADVETVNDYILFMLSWIFDLNFRPSLEAALRRRVIWQLSAKLPSNKDLEVCMHGLEARLKRMANLQ